MHNVSHDFLNSVLGKILSLKELASVLQAASSKITNCKVAGTADGLTVTADSGFETQKAMQVASLERCRAVM